jgi:hypothetical protein
MHIEYERIEQVFPKMIRALKKGGIIYASFKYGEGEGFLGKRFYTYMNEERMHGLLSRYDELETVEEGIFGNEHPGQMDFRWLYVILRRK